MTSASLHISCTHWRVSFINTVETLSWRGSRCSYLHPSTTPIWSYCQRVIYNACRITGWARGWFPTVSVALFPILFLINSIPIRKFYLTWRRKKAAKGWKKKKAWGSAWNRIGTGYLITIRLREKWDDAVCSTRQSPTFCLFLTKIPIIF